MDRNIIVSDLVVQFIRYIWLNTINTNGPFQLFKPKDRQDVNRILARYGDYRLMLNTTEIGMHIGLCNSLPDVAKYYSILYRHIYGEIR